MRNVIIVGKRPLDSGLATWLNRHGWVPDYVSSVGATTEPVGAQSALVGLALFPEVDEPEARRSVQETVRRYPHVKWVGAFDKRQLADITIKKFISNSLYDYQVYPLHLDRVSMALGHAYGLSRIQRDLDKRQDAEFSCRWGLLGSSRAMQEVCEMVLRASQSNCPVLVSGPTGTGKELAARSIHRESERSAGPFVAVNCAAIPASLLQAELFGYAKGAFTGAEEDRAGLMEKASGGTLFLDEIGDMPMESQAVLLRALEEGSIVRLGSVLSISVDLRVVASTNKNLANLLKEDRFRPDLYYRLSVLRVDLPPLRNREDDIEILAKHFIRQGTENLGGPTGLALSPDALEAMRRYDWPGNVRELRNCLFKAIVRCSGNRILLRDLEFEDLKGPQESKSASQKESLRESRDAMQEKRLEEALALRNGNMTLAARDLGVSRTTLYRLVAKYGLSRRGEKVAASSKLPKAS